MPIDPIRKVALSDTVMDSPRLSGIVGEDVAVTVRTGETFEQAEDRTIRENPDAFEQSEGSAFGSDLADEQLAQSRSQLNAIDENIETLTGELLLTQDKKKADILVKKLSELRELRKKFAPTEIDPIKRGVIEAVKPQLAKLKDIETTAPIASVFNAGIQNLGGLLDLNPELTSFKQSQEGLKIPVLRKILNEVGATQAQEQEAAKRLSFPTGTGLFAQNVRPALLDNTFDSVKGISGIDMRNEFSEELLKAIGAEVNGEILGPRVGSLEGLVQAGTTTLDAIKDVAGLKPIKSSLREDQNKKKQPQTDVVEDF